MRRNWVLFFFVAAGSALSWLPDSMWPNLDLPGWSELILIAVFSAFGTILSGGLWFRFLISSVTGTIVGLWGGSLIWPPVDPEGAAFLPLAIIVAASLTAAVSLIVGLAARRLSVTNRSARCFIWIAFGLCLLIGPTLVVLTPPLVARRIARNDRLVASRFASLKSAAERAAVENGGPDKICDGAALERNYSGPLLSGSDWKYIRGNYVREDGYMLGIWCHQQGGYTIDVAPYRGKADGTKGFCADESGHVGCGMKLGQYPVVCAPCG